MLLILTKQENHHILNHSFAKTAVKLAFFYEKYNSVGDLCFFVGMKRKRKAQKLAPTLQKFKRYVGGQFYYEKKLCTT
jgi:hypothetical protein